MKGRLAFERTYHVPRETMQRLDIYSNLLHVWQTRMNLVAHSTLDCVWERHFANSAQLASIPVDIPNSALWLDIGSGAGFPALVLALFVPGQFHLIEATGKKCQFLIAAANALGIVERVTVHNCRVEDFPPLKVNFITARACAPLEKLFAWGGPHGDTARWLLAKGRTAADEVAAARLVFDFNCILVASRTDPEARIVDASGVRRRRA